MRIRHRVTTSWRSRRVYDAYREERREQAKQTPVNVSDDAQEQRRAYIESKRHTRAQLAAWGISWPPEKGWKKRLIQCGIPGQPELGSQVTPSEKPKRARRPKAKIPKFTASTLPPFDERPAIVILEGPYPARHPVPSDMVPQRDEATETFRAMFGPV